jgi:hypothetical protein
MTRIDATAMCENRVTQVSFHAQQRLRQRGFRESDLDRMRRYWEVFDDGFLMSNRSIDEHIKELKSEIQHLERLKNTVLIEQDNTVVTVYRSDRRRRRQILRGRRRKNPLGRNYR